MTRRFRTAQLDDLAAMAELAAVGQADPSFHIVYLGADPAAIAGDVGELDGWTAVSAVAEEDGTIVGWLVADVDPEMGRVWWWGPFAAADDRWDSTADLLYRHARRALPPGITEEEACGDDRSEPIGRWSTRNGFQPDPASVLLRRVPVEIAADSRVRPLARRDHDLVQGLHALAFPGTHTTPEALVRSDHPRAVIEVDGRVAGYVAYELQSDGSGYIDFLAVEPDRRGRGLGGALVDQACSQLFAAGALEAHLTVRADNAAARALYRRLGFIEERVARPYRIGFHLL